MLLYPQLSRRVGQEIFDSYAGLSIPEVAKRTIVEHPRASFAPTGGYRVSEAHLLSLQDDVRNIAIDCGYPAVLNDLDARNARSSRFDIETAGYLFDCMQITPHAATQRGGWYFLTCALLPDVVLWRWGRSPDRWLERGSRVNRNCFGRLWWRTHLVVGAGSRSSVINAERSTWLSLLSEDNWLQLLERPGVTGYRPLTIAILRACFPGQQYIAAVPQEALVRNVLQRFSRLSPLIAFEALTQNQLQELAEDVVRETIIAMVEPPA